MTARIGVDADLGLVHTVVGRAANVDDMTQAGALLHGDEMAAHGNAGCQGMHEREDAQRPHWHVAMQLGKRRQLTLTHRGAQLLKQAEQLKASIRVKVEHPFHVIKNLFRHKKVRYTVRLERAERPRTGRTASEKLLRNLRYDN
jgi:IS5 family transposase